jgi:hypothetical protein
LQIITSFNHYHLMKLKLILALGLASIALRATAGTIDFENMPTAYWYYGSQTNFGNYWAGVNFGPNATILEDQVYGYNSYGYPPHSGHAVLFSIDTPYIDASFASAVDSVSLWFTSGWGSLTIDAYDAGNNLIDSVSGSSNYGTSSYLSMTHGSSDIAWVKIHDHGNYFTIDDFTSPTTSGQPSRVPDAANTLGLIAASMAGLITFRRFMAKARV